MEDEELDIDAIKKIQMKPGDVGIIIPQNLVNDEILGNLRTYWRETFPDNKCMVLPQGTKFGIVQMFDDDDSAERTGTSGTA